MNRIPDACDRCGKPVKRSEMRRLRMDVGTSPSAVTRWVSDEFRRYYCPECTRKAKAMLIAFEKGCR